MRSRGAGAVFLKEAMELAQDRRTWAILAAAAVLLGVVYTLLAQQTAGGSYAPEFGEAAFPLAVAAPPAVLLIAWIAQADAFAKERETRMLDLLLTAPLTRGALYAGKVAGGYLLYAAFVAVMLAAAAAASRGFGGALLESALWMAALPLLALYTCAAGLVAIAGVVTRTSRGAFTATLLLVVPIVLLLRAPPGVGAVLRARAPGVYDALRFNPLQAALDASIAIVRGTPFDATPLAAAAGAGALLLATAAVVFVRAEG